MKIRHLALFPLALTFLGAVVALPEKEGNEDDCPHMQVAAEQEAAAKAAADQAAAEAQEVAKEPYPAQCDEQACIEKIEKATQTILREREMMAERLVATKKQGDESMALTDSLKPKIEEQNKIAEEAKSAAETTRRELAASQEAITDAQRRVADCNSSSKSKIKALEMEIAAANAVAAHYSAMRFFLNTDLIKADIKDLMKKAGLIKDEL